VRLSTLVATLVLLGLLPTAAPARADDVFSRFDKNILFGLGIVGQAQYDQGQPKLVATANFSGFFRASESVSFGGVGVAVRSTEGPFAYFFESDNFNEFGVAVPLVTWRSGWKVAQLGVEIQRADMTKNLYYFAVGYGWSARRPAVKATPAPTR
jgi:hypothetical protein